MSIREKAKRYDEILEQLKGLIEVTREHKCAIMEEDIIDIFTELKESEDERIRKALIDYLDDANKADENPLQSYGIHTDKAIDWLEKLGEKPQGKTALEAWRDMRLEVYQQASGNRHEPNYSDDTTKMFSLNDIDEIIEKISEQKSADEVEPKFEIEKGKWYVCNTSRYTDFIVGKAYYCPKNGMLKPNENEIARYVAKDCFHLWTINDAKNGDVLTTTHDNGIGQITFIFKRIIDDDMYCYCLYDSDMSDKLCFDPCTDSDFIGCVSGAEEEFHPATKEQRDLLFQKMKEAGYEWDAEKKELRKIKRELAWSEKDEMMIEETLYFLREYQHSNRCKDENGMQNSVTCENWLKSLRPQKQWKPSDEQIIALRWVLNNVPYNKHKEEISGLLDQIKHL